MSSRSGHELECAAADVADDWSLGEAPSRIGTVWAPRRLPRRGGVRVPEDDRLLEGRAQTLPANRSCNSSLKSAFVFPLKGIGAHHERVSTRDRQEIPVSDQPDSPKSLPVMFNYRLHTLSTLVPNEKLVEWEGVLREKIGAKATADDPKMLGYSGGTISMCCDPEVGCRIPEDECDCDYIA